MSKYDLKFDLVESPRGICQLGDFMRAHVGTYKPDRHNAWVEDVCLPAIATEERRALGWWQHGKMVGDSVLKIAATDTVELKNFRVSAPGFSGRGLADFMMRQVMHESIDLLADKGKISPDANAITVRLDTTAGSPAESFFAHTGFVVVDRAELYTPGQEEVIMQRGYALN